MNIYTIQQTLSGFASIRSDHSAALSGAPMQPYFTRNLLYFWPFWARLQGCVPTDRSKLISSIDNSPN